MGLVDMSSMAASIGVSVAVLRFLLCFVAMIPVSFAWRIVPSGIGKHLYAAASGALLSYLSFGFSSNLHFLVPMTIGYASMAVYRPNHVFYMSGDAWKEGGIDSTGALMVLTLKVISCAMNYNDGMLKEEGLREAQKKNRLVQMPSLIEYFGYCLCCGSHFAGPVYETKDYLEWTEGKGIWDTSNKRKQPSPFEATVRAIFQAAICMALYLYLVPQYPLTRFTEPVYQEWGFLRKFSYQYMAGFTARWKYYFIWSISEASIIISGLGFSGWTNDASPKPKWDRAKNVDILGVELAKSAVQIPLVWNIQVSTWLRHYVYERLVQNGKKAGFFQLLATQTVSAVWHGLYPGYMMFFVQSALMIAGSRVIYRWQQAISPQMAMLRKSMVFINFLYTVLVLNYSAVGFMVLSLHETLTAYGSVYYIGTILPVVLILLSYVVPAKPSRAKPRKEE
ncbi:PREDICTED: lysophospholipid acyltransferase 1-like isoform X2 [Camelina sativa]|uniref:Lysophospholipid acyltransferase 1-like isoform X2 n=1 Tax=Camelina sativa TaxID=90675 RepID=A0ABM0Y2H4_CAMSA|nr:PREDICTED: lysophospholipid acyltransferase 1-like isoform X2 [Camelina sativa]